MSTAYCFDLDGTLTRQELLPIIAACVGLEDEIAVLTQATLDGLIPFDKSFKLRVRLLRDVPVERIHAALAERIEFDPHMLSFIAERADQCFVVTGNLDIWVKPTLDRLNIRSFTSRAALGSGGQPVGVASILHKGDAVDSLKERFERIVAVGDGMNDVPMFESADWRIAYGGTHAPNPTLVKLSDFIVNEGRSLCRLLSTL